jgi:type VI protein secretion system component Hcp
MWRSATVEKDIGSTNETVTLQYGQIQDTHFVTGPAGKVSVGTTFAWDRVRNVQGFGAQAFKPISNPATKSSDLGLAKKLPTTSPLRFYVSFTTYDGNLLKLDQTAAGGPAPGLYEISAADFSALQTLNIGSQSSGAGAGKVAFNPLTLSLGSDNLTALLDKMMAAGTPLKFLDLYTVSPAPTSMAKAKLVTQDEFGLVAVKTDTVTPLTGTHTFSFEYGSLVESSAPTTGTANVVGGWDRVKNVSDTTISGPTFDFTKPPPVSFQTPANERLDSYVQFRDAKGALLGGADGGWIHLADATYDMAQMLNLGSSSSGAGAGKITFDPLSLSFAPGSLSPLLLSTLAAGQVVSVEVATFDAVTKGLVEDVALGTAALATVEKDIGSTNETVTLQYGQIQDTHFVTGPAGKVSVGTTFAWDRVRNVQGFGAQAFKPISNPATKSSDLHLAPGASGALFNQFAAALSTPSGDGLVGPAILSTQQSMITSVTQPTHSPFGGAVLG